MKVFALLVFFLFLIGCGKPPPMQEPEMLDPIYQDILAERTSTDKFMKVSEKSIESAHMIWKEATPQTQAMKRARANFFKKQKSVRKLKQQIKYMDLLLETRKIAVRKSYIKAYRNGTPWPDPKENERYIASKKLRNAPLEWRLRVPRLDDRFDNYVAKKMKEKKKKK